MAMTDIDSWSKDSNIQCLSNLTCKVFILGIKVSSNSSNLIEIKLKLAKLSVTQRVFHSRAHPFRSARFICLLRVLLSVLATTNQWKEEGTMRWWHSGGRRGYALESMLHKLGHFCALKSSLMTSARALFGNFYASCSCINLLALAKDGGAIVLKL